MIEAKKKPIRISPISSYSMLVSLNREILFLLLPYPE